MNSQNNQAGFGSTVVIGILAVLTLAGGAYFLSHDEEKHMEDKKDEMRMEKDHMDGDMMGDEDGAMMKDAMADPDSAMEKTMEDSMMSDEKDAMESAAGGTMMKDDPRLESMDAADLAADGGAAPLPEAMSDEAMMESEMEKEAPAPETGMQKAEPGQFLSFTSLADAQNMAETKDVILFFHAAWCPSCRALESDITKNAASIPADTVIYKLDYDTETELKKQFGVVRQHTLVQINESGAAVKTLTGLTNTLSQVVNQL